MKLYIGLAGPLLLFVYLPLVLIVLAVLFSKIKSWKHRAWVAPLCLILAYAIPLGDVTWHSWNMAKVCPKAGLHVYRTAVVDGFLGEFSGGDTLRQHPYVFVERTTFPGTSDAVRFSRSGDKVINIRIPRPTAEWEYIRAPFDYPDKLLGVTVNREIIRNRVTGEVIAEDISFRAWRGWIDAKIASVIDNVAGVCYERPGMSDKFPEILVPSGTTK